ncbi:hypothetical protein GCM10023068_13130 [Leifsonia shinshuensis]|uniref:Surfactin synthase thioesterase subunit n=2 Tax=Leifsonia shinshuensis TaxID=150026 RepID=A0A853CRI8_9MICO|nr:surfactin synthase thioesterase subunit [Leifsonia shinshuensis]
MGATLAFEVALRLQDVDRLEHVFLAAARPPWEAPDGATAFSVERAAARASALSGELSERAREILLEDLALLASYPGRRPEGQLKVPATILYSNDDPVVAAIDSARWASWCSAEPRLVELSGVGHLFHRASLDVLAVVQSTLSPLTPIHTATPASA